MGAKRIERIMFIRPGVRFPRLGFGQPRGVLCLASLLQREYPGAFEFHLVEQALYDLDADQVAERIRGFEPDLIGFSCLTVEAEEMHKLAAVAKAWNPSALTVLGGPHASMFYHQALKDPHLDVAVVNEGEATFLDLIGALRDDRPLHELPGLAFAREGQVEVTPPRPFIRDLDQMPLPAWELVDLAAYSRQPSMNVNYYHPRYAMIVTSRGCPSRCVYCHNLFGKRVRFRSVEWVIAEIDLLARHYGVRELYIVDDMFNADLDRAKRICDEIIQRNYGIKIAFPNGLRADRMDRELIEKLKEAGCYSITYGVETASPRLQARIRKNLDLEKTRRVISWTYESGIIPQGFFMLGFPGETVAEIEATVDYAIRSKLLRAWFFSVVVYPHSNLYELAKTEYPEFDWSSWDMAAQRPWAENDFYTRATGVNLFQLVRRANRRFYLRFWVIVMLLWLLPKNRSLLRGIYYGLRAVFTPLYRLESGLKARAKAVRKRFRRNQG